MSAGTHTAQRKDQRGTALLDWFFIMTYKEKYNAYLKSDKWAQMKLDLIEIRGQKCERCGVKRTFRYLHLLHLTYERVFHEEPNDLELLCGGCHIIEHGIKKPKPQRIYKKKSKRKKKLSKADIRINSNIRKQIKRLKAELKSNTITVSEYAKQLKEIRSGEIKKIR